MLLIFACLWIASLAGLVYGYAFLDYLLPQTSFFSFLGALNFFFVIGIPVIGLVLLVTRLFFGAHILPTWRTGLWAFWGINLLSLATITGLTIKDFQTRRDIVITKNKTLTNADTLIIRIEEDPYDDDWGMLMDELQLSGDELISRSIEVNIKKGTSGLFQFDQKVSARGKNTADALSRAQTIEYQPRIDQNTLWLPHSFVIPKGSKWRNQRVKINIQVPEGKFVKIVPPVNQYLHELDIDENVDHPWIPGIGREYTWQMTSDGLISQEYLDKLTHTYEVRAFSDLEINGNVPVHILRGDNYSVTLKGTCDCPDRLDINQIGTKLNIKTNARIRNATLQITLPRLSTLKLKHTDNVHIEGFEQEKMAIWAEERNNRHISASLQVDDLTLHLKGRMNFELIGTGDHLRAKLDSETNLQAGAFVVRNADITAEGSMDIELNVQDTLRQKRSPDVNIELVGSPTVLDIQSEDTFEE